jgi:maltose-binding protein MalE
MKTSFLCLWALCLVPTHLFGWTNGQLLIWMDPDRGHALKPLAQKFHDDFGISATIETPQNITDSFPLAAQVAKGPDIVIWTHLLVSSTVWYSCGSFNSWPTRALAA